MYFLTDITTQMCHDLTERCEKAYFNNSILHAATYMDPRYRKMTFIHNQNDRDKATSDAIRHIKTLYRAK